MWHGWDKDPAWQKLDPHASPCSSLENHLGCAQQYMAWPAAPPLRGSGSYVAWNTPPSSFRPPQAAKLAGLVQLQLPLLLQEACPDLSSPPWASAAPFASPITPHYVRKESPPSPLLLPTLNLASPHCQELCRELSITSFNPPNVVIPFYSWGLGHRKVQ